MKNAKRILDKTSDLLAAGTGLTAGILLLLIILIVVYEIISRRLFNSPTIWSIELVVIFLVWFCLMTLGFCQKEKRHVRVDILISYFSEKTTAYWNIVTLSITLLFTILLIYYSWDGFWHSLITEERFPSVWEPYIWPMKLALPVGCILLIIQLITDIVSNIYMIKFELLKNGDRWFDKSYLLIILFFILLGYSAFLLTSSPISGLILMLLLLLFAGVPVFATLGLIGMYGLYYHYGGSLALTQVPEILYGTLGNFSLAALPLFILTGFVLQMSGAGEELYDLFAKWMGRLPGGLGLATIFSCAFFAAISISSVATVATIGLIALPSLLKRSYSHSFSYGLIGSGATLGIMIPPSATMILYAAVTEESMGRLLIAGLIPGLMMVTLFGIYSVIFCKRSGTYEKEQAWSWDERWKAMRDAVWVLLVPIIITAGIFTGVFTVLECGGIASVYTIVMVIIRRKIGLRDIPRMLRECGGNAGFIIIIIAGALTMGRFLTLLQIPQQAMTFVNDVNFAPWMVISFIMIMFIVLGLFLEVASVMMITLPVIYPIIIGLGYDGVWFAVLMTLNMEMALLTPPVGLNLFVIQGIARAPLGTIIKGTAPFFLIMVLGMLIIYFFPQISLWLPNLMIN
ncbi:MAG: TRAP transporter large permease subunit [Spirochaetota bacterium]|nr:TRAP transporter large permease subunit [Spirochaetota bacterium]